ncbi:MAG: MarR family transcriptional regulator, partial [Bacillota bacterium]|nr:MarR family transcriptional regulator [Bacillota bacterium]
IDKQDRRAFIISITNKGQELKEQILPIIESAFQRLLNNITDEEIEIYRKVLLKMNENLDIR